MPAIADNLAQVRERLAVACRRAGRSPEEVLLIAVTKTASPEQTAELYRLGVRDFGENRTSPGLEQMRVLAASDARWHFIGHLQRNKAAETLAGGFTRIHSVESAKLLDVLDRGCARLNIVADILLEVSVAGEEEKYGVSPAALPALADAAAEKKHLRFLGLMTMAPFTDDPETSRPVFRELAALRQSLRQRLGLPLPHLSMGMTGDFEVAAEEGATMVRVGTALFR